MREQASVQRVQAVRRFNRFYTGKIGVLSEGLLDSEFSLAEARVLYEIANREDSTATELCRDLGLDAGYLSRILRGLKKRGLVASRASQKDRRQYLLRLTARGRNAFAPLDARTNDEIAGMLGRLSEDDQRRLVDALSTVESILSDRPANRAPYLLRQPQPGDIGWVVHRHGALYAQEYGWDERFEALVADIASKFVRNFEAKRERCWIAERDGEIIGFVFLVKRSKTVAQLRMLIVEPKARGLGVGARLVDECERFARQAGYKKIILWTNSVLAAARRIYEKAGYKLIREEPHTDFGPDLIAETWELKL